MTSPTPDHWQIQDAKQRFSEMIRAVTRDGPQVITRHGEDVAAGFADRVLPVTLQVAGAWGRQQYRQPLPVIDALIAATAQVHGMIVVTRNVKDFELAGVEVLNPFTE